MHLSNYLGNFFPIFFFRYEPILVQEMLSLIIQIVKERRFCGLTNAECLRRELVYKLSVGDATHSQLVKSLPRDLSKIDNFQEILDSVAVYSNPSGINQVCVFILILILTTPSPLPLPTLVVYIVEESFGCFIFVM